MRKTPSAVVVALLLAGAACSSDPATAPIEPQHPAGDTAGSSAANALPTGPTGSVGFQLTLPDGSSISIVHWSITGPNNSSTVVKSGSVDVHASGGTKFQVSEIPEGMGYRVLLSAMSVDGGIDCEGSASFAVVARATTQVDVQLACTAAGAGQTTVVNGTSFDCAAWNSVSASPNETAVGTPVSLSATATGPIPANLTYRWSAPSGQFTAPTAANTNFVCSTPGPVNVTLVVGDGAVPEGSTCNPALDTDVITVTCTGTAPPPAAPAMPPWGSLALATGLLGVGCGGLRRRRASLRPDG
jgi:hypothetical protein